MMKTKPLGAAIALLCTTACFDPVELGSNTSVDTGGTDDADSTSGNDTFTLDQPFPDTGTGDSATGDNTTEGTTGDEPDVDTVDTSDEPNEPDPDAEYRHPLQNVGLVNGLVPGVEIHDSPDGMRYGIVDAFGEDEYGFDRQESGIETYKVTRVPSSKKRLEASPKRGVISKRLRERFAQVNYSSESMGVVVHPIERATKEIVTSQWQLARAIGRGEVRTHGEEKMAKVRIREGIRKRIAETLAPMVKKFRNEGLEVRPAKYTHSVMVKGPANKLEEVLTRRSDAFEFADVPEKTRPQEEVNNRIVREVHDTEFLYDNGYDGNDDGTGSAIVVGQIEAGGNLRLTHHGFRDGTNPASTRIRGHAFCDEDGCTRNPSWTSGFNGHAVRSAQMLMGDLTDNQISGMLNEDEKKYTGACPECELYFVYEEDGWWDDIADYFNDRSKVPELVHINVGSHSPHCDGESTTMRQVDEGFYERGMLPVVAAGNVASDDPWAECEVRSPGASHSALTIGNLSRGYDVQDRCHLSTSGLRESSPKGNKTVDGRTIIDLVSNGSYMRWFDDDDDTDLRTAGHSGTSYSSPYVAGGTAAFMDAYLNRTSNWVKDPGALKTIMLMQGDMKQLGYGNYPDTEFGNMYGAGRYRAMSMSSDWSDAPFKIKSGSVCLKDGDLIDIPVTETVHPGMSLKVVTWTYSHRWNTSGQGQRLDLRLRWSSEPSWQSLIIDDSDDTKKRAIWYRPNSGGIPVDTISLYGKDITTDEAGCGSNSALVFWTWIVEDHDRNDSNGPDWNTNTCQDRAPHYKYP